MDNSKVNGTPIPIVPASTSSSAHLVPTTPTSSSNSAGSIPMETKSAAWTPPPENPLPITFITGSFPVPVAGTSNSNAVPEAGSSKSSSSNPMTGESSKQRNKKRKRVPAPEETGQGDSGKKVYQFKVTLKHTKPPIWRRIHMPEDATFLDLHYAIQEYMGWCGHHLHEFKFGHGLNIGNRGQLLGSDDEESEDDEQCDFFGFGMFGNGDRNILSESKEKLAQHFGMGFNKSCTYEYDFGDGWAHGVLLEKIVPAEANQVYPKCVTGRRACPPEDCGGVDGFEELVNSWLKPASKRTKDEQKSLKYYGMLADGYDPSKFDPTGSRLFSGFLGGQSDTDDTDDD